MLNAEITSLMKTADAPVNNAEDISSSVGGSWIARARASKAIVSATTRLNNTLREQQEIAPRLVRAAAHVLPLSTAASTLCHCLRLCHCAHGGEHSSCCLQVRTFMTQICPPIQVTDRPTTRC
eukprot:SAG22_NODE_10080_length_554_cov_0.727473_1_plen_122_part_01